MAGPLPTEPAHPLVRFAPEGARLLRARDYQPRPEFDRLLDWWRGGDGSSGDSSGGASATAPSGGKGVCALVGIGGAGKTAMADRFLRILPGVMEVEPGLPASLSSPSSPTVSISPASLPPPGAVFAFSFYDAPNAEQFFDDLYQWLVDAWGIEDRRARTAAGGIQRASEPLVVEALNRLPHLPPPPHRLLLVLDGLEKLQDDGARDANAFGRILDGGLRAFVAAGVEGRLRGIGILITTRFRLFDMEAFAYESGSPLFLPINVERLPVESCVSLLRARGVEKGTEDDLIRLAEAQGRHALTVSLMGGYISEFCDGDPRAIPPEPFTPAPAVAGPGKEEFIADPRVRALRAQEHRFARVAARYREGFKERDPAALALLERLCLFRLGVDADLMASVFLGEGKERIAGPHLAALTRQGMETRLQRLVEMRLVEATRKPNKQPPSSSTHSPSPIPNSQFSIPNSRFFILNSQFSIHNSPRRARWFPFRSG